MRLIIRFLKFTDMLFLSVAAAASAGFFLCVLAQVFYRYVLEAPLPWTEELARYLFVWTAMLAAAVSVGRSDQFNIPMFADWLGDESRRWLEVLLACLGIGFAFVMVWYGSKMSSRFMGAVAPVLPVSQGLVYLCIPVAGVYMIVHLAWRLFSLVSGQITGRTTTPW